MADNEILNLRAGSITNFELAKQAYNSKNYKNSLELSLKAQELRQKSFSADDTKTDESYCAILELIAQNQYHLKDYDNSLENLELSLSHLEKIYYAGHNRLAPILENMACIYEEKKDYDKLESTLIRLLEIYEKTISAEHRNVLNTYLRLANLYFERDKTEDCQKIITKALKQLDSPLGPIEEFWLLNARIAQKNGNIEETKANLNKAIIHFEMRQNFAKLKQCYELMLKVEENSQEKANIQSKIEHFSQLATNIHNVEPFSSTLLRA